ncbi:hypothetical protein AwErysi_08290 [Erysipelotrichaceae bacterium]|nr:hypothetical protein AwErysi_08290 [Erysipelotrichaceae bacterium]
MNQDLIIATLALALIFSGIMYKVLVKKISINTSVVNTEQKIKDEKEQG